MKKPIDKTSCFWYTNQAVCERWRVYWKSSEKSQKTLKKVIDKLKLIW